MKINYESDFVAVFSLPDGYEGDFKIEMRTSGKSVEASCIGGEMKNIAYADGKYAVVMKDHGLQPGKLKCKLHLWHGNQWAEHLKNVTPIVFDDIELVTGKGDSFATADLSLIAPFIKGEKGERGEKGEIPDTSYFATKQDIETVIGNIGIILATI